MCFDSLPLNQLTISEVIMYNATIIVKNDDTTDMCEVVNVVLIASVWFKSTNRYIASNVAIKPTAVYGTFTSRGNENPANFSIPNSINRNPISAIIKICAFSTIFT